MLGVVVALALAARITGSLRLYLLATTPLVASILIVNTFFFPGATDEVLRIGPIAATGAGLTAGVQGALRVIAFALSVAVFAVTTPTDDLLSDLERRGVGRRLTFVIGTAIQTVPRMLERAGEIVESQRARGLDTEGSLWRRVRGVVPLAGPMVLGALGDVEERTLALEARAFSAKGRRTVIRELYDSPTQRLVRWTVGLGSIALVIAAATNVLALP